MERNPHHETGQAEPDPTEPDPTASHGASPQRRRILDAATALLAAGGAEALRVRSIAEAADCSTMGVYSHFGGKDGVVDAIYADGFERFEQALRDGWPGRATSRMKRIGRAYRGWALANPGAYGVMFAGTVPGFAPSPESLTIATSAFDVLLDAVRHEQESDRFRAGDPLHIAWSIWGTVHGLVMLELAGMTPPGTSADPEAIFEASLASAHRAFG